MQDESKVRRHSKEDNGGSRQRKWGTVVRHPLDMVDTNTSLTNDTHNKNVVPRSSSAMEKHRQTPNYEGGVREKENKRTGSLSFLPLKRAGKTLLIFL